MNDTDENSKRIPDDQPEPIVLAQPAVAKDQSIAPDSSPTIDLDQFLKTCGVETGGQAKRLIQGGEVLLNGIIETRRRKKLRHGDEVTVFGDTFVVEFGEMQ